MTVSVCSLSGNCVDLFKVKTGVKCLCRHQLGEKSLSKWGFQVWDRVLNEGFMPGLRFQLVLRFSSRVLPWSWGFEVGFQSRVKV